MAMTLGELAEQLTTGGLRHHVDAEEQAIRVVFVTRCYVNSRGERLAILRLEATDGGTSFRVTMPRAFAAGSAVAATCLALCEAVSEVPLARVEPDATSGTLQLAAELPIEDGSVTPRQVFAVLDALVEAAEAGQAAVEAISPSGGGEAREAA